MLTSLLTNTGWTSVTFSHMFGISWPYFNSIPLNLTIILILFKKKTVPTRSKYAHIPRPEITYKYGYKRTHTHIHYCVQAYIESQVCHFFISSNLTYNPKVFSEAFTHCNKETIYR